MQPGLPACFQNRRNPRWFWTWLAVVLAATLALRHIVIANTDVSWLLIEAEKMLDGQRLYTDLIETNPPVAPLTCLPAVLLERWLRIRAETAMNALVFIAIAASVGAAICILKSSRLVSADGRDPGWPFAIFCLTTLTIFPMQTFGQREHLALIALLPAFAAFVVRARNQRLPLWGIVVSGLGAGLTLTFKPYFVIPVGAGLITAAWLAHSWRAMFAPEYFLTAALVVLYAALTFIFFPDYFTLIYPLVRDVYIPTTALPTIGGTAGPIWAGALIMTLLLRRAQDDPDAVVALLVAVSVGFAVAFILQRKGWAYQSYPMIALALIALAYAIDRLPLNAKSGRTTLRVVGLACLVTTFCSGALWMNHASDARALIAPVARLGAHPKILVLSGEPSIGHPLTRAVNGQWVSRQQSLWVKEFVARLRRDRTIDPVSDARLTAYVDAERTRLIEDIKRTPPDVILVDNLLDDWGEWLRADPELSNLLSAFRRIDTVQNIDILRHTAIGGDARTGELNSAERQSWATADDRGR